LQLEPAKPPEILYHGTATHSVHSILKDGLEKRSRVHVHLSIDVPTARSVGSRHGSPVILRIMSGKMHEDGHTFYCSTSGVWLVESVPAQYLQVVE
jgi:putative RNA 2'-phosphotransferase